MVANRRGFTLIELVIIIVIFGILAAVAIPKYLDHQSTAEDSAICSIYGNVMSTYGITIASLKTQPTVAELNANLSGDMGSMRMNTLQKPNIVAGTNSITGVKKTGTFDVIVTGGSISAIGNLTVN
jgi:prepilin-type N-terminal cleavage/methylation domain-containing protein